MAVLSLRHRSFCRGRLCCCERPGSLYPPPGSPWIWMDEKNPSVPLNLDEKVCSLWIGWKICLLEFGWNSIIYFFGFTPSFNFNAIQVQACWRLPKSCIKFSFTLCQSLHFSFVFMFSIYILHVTSCESKEKRLKMPLINVAIILFLWWFVYVLWVSPTSFCHCCNDIHVDLRADLHYEGLVHCEHEVLNLKM